MSSFPILKNKTGLFHHVFIFLLFITIININDAWGQKETYNWYFGSFGGIKFTGVVPAPSAISGTKLNSQEPSTSVSDANGNIIFYSDGQRIWDATNTVMPNGAGLMGGNSSSQGAVAVRQPGSGNIYYLFTTDNLDGSNGLRYSIIDMTLVGNGTGLSPKGDVVAGQKNKLLLNKSIEGVSATTFANCKDIWIVGHEAGTNTFYSFLLTPTGVTAGPASSIGSVKVNGRGNMMFSPNGDKLALAFSNSITNVEVFNFDKVTGSVTKIIAKIPSSPSTHSDGYGVEFSPNGDILYVTHHLLGYIKQYDLTAINVAATQFTFNPGGGPGSGQPKMGPDGRMYIPRNLQGYVSIIKNPDVLGAGAGYQQVGFNLAPGTLGLLGMPQMFFPSAPIDLVSIILDDATCSSKGSITVNVTGGTPPIVYSNDGGITFQSSNVFPDLDPGTYIIVAKDSKGCYVTDSVELKTAAGPAIDSVKITADSCGACLGTLKIFASGGTPPLKYSIDGGTTWKLIGDFSGLCEAVYSIAIEDNVGCGFKFTKELEDDGIPKDATIHEAGPFCVTDDPQTLVSNTPGGDWDGTGIVDKVNGVFDPEVAGPGLHTVYYTITGVCGNSDSITIEVTDTLNPTIQPIDPFCITDSALILSAQVTGGVWSGDGIIDSLTGNFDPNKAGVGKHKIIYTVSGTCVDKDSIEIDVQDTINPQIKPVDRICPDGLPFNLEAVIKGGVWSGTGIIDPVNGTFDPTKVNPGSVVTVYYTLLNACSDKDSIQITITQKLGIAFTPPTPPRCHFQNNIELPFEITGTGIDEVIWDMGDGTTINNQTKIKHTYKDYDVYNGSVMVKDTICGLDTTINFTIDFKVPSEFHANVGITNNPIACFPFEAVFYNNSDGVEHFWDFGDGNTSTEKLPVHKYEKEGEFTVKYIGTNSAYCVPTDTQYIDVNVIKVKSLWGEIEFSHPKACSYFSTNLDVEGMFTGYSADSIVWDWGDGSNKVILQNNQVDSLLRHIYTQEGKYIVKVEFFDRWCGDDTTLYMPFEHRKISENGSIAAPNIFTPNGDGINDEFKLFFFNRKDYDVYQDILQYQILIYDRWGRKMFDSNVVNLEYGDNPRHWDGTLKSKPLPTGVYFYLVSFKVKCYDDGDAAKYRNIKGHVTISK